MAGITEAAGLRGWLQPADRKGRVALIAAAADIWVWIYPNNPWDLVAGIPAAAEVWGKTSLSGSLGSHGQLEGVAWSASPQQLELGHHVKQVLG